MSDENRCMECCERECREQCWQKCCGKNDCDWHNACCEDDGGNLIGLLLLLLVLYCLFCNNGNGRGGLLGGLF